jgi:hypothetical protein
MDKTLKGVEGPMYASVFGTPDPAVKDDQHPSIPRQFNDVHVVLLESP